MVEIGPTPHFGLAGLYKSWWVMRGSSILREAHAHNRGHYIPLNLSDGEIYPKCIGYGKVLCKILLRIPFSSCFRPLMYRERFGYNLCPIVPASGFGWPTHVWSPQIRAAGCAGTREGPASTQNPTPPPILWSDRAPTTCRKKWPKEKSVPRAFLYVATA